MPCGPRSRRIETQSDQRLRVVRGGAVGRGQPVAPSKRDTPTPRPGLQPPRPTSFLHGAPGLHPRGAAPFARLLWFLAMRSPLERTSELSYALTRRPCLFTGRPNAVTTDSLSR